MMLKHPDTFSLKTLLPALFVLGMVATLSAFWWPPVMQIACAAGWAAYLILVLGTSLRLAIGTGSLPMAFRLPLVYFTIHVASGTGLWIEWFSSLLGPFRRDGSSPPAASN
jgi:hypothetical protein